MKKICNILIALLLIIISSAPLFGATRIYYENFDDQDIDAPFYLSDGSTYTWATGYNGSGSSLYIRESDDEDTNIMFKPSSWSSNEFYMSAWMRFPTLTYDENDPQRTGIKMFYVYSNNTTGYVAIAFTDSHSYYYSAKDRNGNIIASGIYGGIGFDMKDGEWHKFALYINWSTGRVVFMTGSNDTIRRDTTYGEGTWVANEFYKAHFPSVCTEGVADGGSTVFSKQMDEYEVWNGFPGSLSPSITIGSPSSGATGVDVSDNIIFNVLDSDGDLPSGLTNHSKFYVTVEKQ